MEEDMRKLDITKDMAEDRKITSKPRSGKLGLVNKDDDDDDDRPFHTNFYEK